MPPDVALLDALRCPHDGGRLDLEPHAFRCRECNARYAVVDGIPDFVTDAAASTARWRAAQRYELDYWTARGAEARLDTDSRWAAAADGLAKRFDEVARGDWRARVLHVGPAGRGEIHHLPGHERVAVEPLALALDHAGLLERGDIQWVAAMGECLPFPDAWFSAAVVPNVIDHVADPPRLLGELKRCLRRGAPVWITSHVTDASLAPWLAMLSRTRLGYFAGHPHAFTPGTLRRLVGAAGLEVLDDRSGPAVDPDASASLRTRIKNRVLASRYLLARA